ncbi:MAG: terpene cyclase/mutase family protein [Planctomycetota bacterium]|nr:terpene cyclase/mutase family protein [Planctomycetota bacterium]
MTSAKELPPQSPAPVPSRWKKALRVLLGVLVFLVLVAAYLYLFETPHHSTPTTAPQAVQASGDKVLDAIRRGIEFLKVHQEADGEFSKGIIDPKPGFTAVVVDAIARSPDNCREADQPFLAKATRAILSHQQKDGSICTPEFSLETYTTAVSIMALTALENPAHAPAIQRAKEYLLAVQYKDDESSPNFGAAGYKTEGRTSGDVTAQWVEALKAAGLKEGDPAFVNAQKFLSRLQNNAETNAQPAPGTAVGSDGGSFYRPGESKAGFELTRDGKRIPKSYGLMSYANLKSFLYLNVGKDDPRVVSAFRWVCDNYTLDENRNIGADGLFYYFLTMSKALTAYGEALIATTDGKTHVWARELSDKLLSLQRPDGSWCNMQSNRWKEDDAVMVTAFALRTLSLCHDELQKHPAQPAPSGGQ